ncbi:MAG: hypothetical protein JSU82_13895 [Rhodospirillales bacterium]|nr:MAG: hypothetical protein JSU82_13895 [Rhodospirillales bacterium]
MFFRYLEHAVANALSFLRDQAGSIMIYTGAFMAIGVGGAALSIDVGRIVLLKTQMQNRADAGALAGAAQLDAFPGAIERSEKVITQAMVAYTTAAADQGELAVWDAEFYAVDPADPSKTKRGPVTTDDGLARFAEVIMERRTLSFFYGPALNLLTGQGADSQTFLDARAVGMSDPFICKMQPLMICNPFDDGIAATTDPDIRDDAYKGYGLRIKQSGQTGAWQPGNFGLLDLPEDVVYSGGGGANAVQAALEAEDPLGCYAIATLETAPGNKTGKVKEGVNVRWYGPNVAPNVMNYPQDLSMIADPNLSFSTDGIWDLATYWSTHHTGALPAPLVNATRYQVYLFEQGQGFWKKGKKTSAAVTIDPPDNTGGWTFVDPAAYPTAAVLPTGTPADDNFVDGVPPPGETISSKAHERRLMKIAVADCATHNFQGNASIPAEGTYVEIFLTEESGGLSNQATIYGELVRGLSPRTSFEFHGNVRLVE